MAFDIQEVLKQCYWAAREYRSNPSDDYIIEKIVGFIDSNNLMADKYADLAQPRAVEKVEYLETALMNAVKPAYKFHAHCPDCQVEFETDNGEWLIWCGTKEHAEAILQAARIVAAQQKKAGS